MMREIAVANVPAVHLDRDIFLRRLIASLGHLNEAVLGSDVAGGYVMNVGLSMGAAIEEEYKRFLGIDRPFTLDEYAHVIVDLKQKIKGNFSLVSCDAEKVVVRTTSCPFDAFVRQSPSLCFMTSSVFGGIAARNFGYGKVILHKRIALGDPGCYVTVYLRRTPEAEAMVGREYFPDIDRASPDIAQQLRLMESTRALYNRLSALNSQWEEVIRGAAEAVCLIELDGRVSFANARWRDLLGIEGDELVGGRFQVLVHADDGAGFESLLGRTSHGQRVTGAELRLRHRDGSWRETLLSAGPVHDEAGRIVGVLALIRDVTPEREAQRLKDDFLSTASHELRTPVTTIRALTDLLLRRLDRGETLDPEQLAHRLRRIREESDRLALLGNDLLDAARHQAGQLRFDTETVDLAELVREVAARQRELHDGPHEIVEQQPESPVWVSIDRSRIEQVLANLLDNAVKYSPDADEVLVETHVGPDRAAVVVTDYGIGIPTHDLANLFTPFYRASNASSLTFSGLGLGLYLSRATVEAHGGELTVESVEGQGTRFTLALPLAESAKGSAVA